MIRSLQSALALALLLQAGVPRSSHAQTAPEHPYSVNVSVGYVMVPFVAVDSSGRTIRTLRQKDVTLLVDGRSVRTDLFERSGDAPVSYTILLDGSGSMALSGKKEAALAAINGLLRHHVTGDDYALYVFGSGEVNEVVPFTRDGNTVLAAARALVPYGKTAFYDALALMPDKTILGGNGARAIILLTDALDNASILTRGQLTAALAGVDVPVYPLGLRLAMLPRNMPKAANPELLSDADTLQQIASETGGRLFVGTDPAEIDQAMNDIQQDLRNQYLVGFTPTGRGAVTYRTISLRLPRSVKVVRVRSGYRGTEPPYAQPRASATAKKK